jgi:hypothetical protein
MFSFKNLSLEHINKATPSVTMHRIGRDNIIVNYTKDVDNENNIIILCYGEVDCRCHIEKQKIEYGRDEDEIIKILVCAYFKTIMNNIKKCKKIIIVAVIPPVDSNLRDNTNDQYNPFPVLGTNETRIRYTNKVNNLIRQLCDRLGYTYFNPYEKYKTEEGCLNYEYADETLLHVKNNKYILDELELLINNI